MAHSIDFNTLLSERKVKSTRLTGDYQFKNFDCGDEDLNNFLFNDSKKLLRHLRYTTTLIETTDRIIAYYSLANDLLILGYGEIENFRDNIESDNNNNIEDNYWYDFINANRYPAVKIGRLAVDKDFQEKGVSSFIMKSLEQSFTVNNKTGCQFITVDAINDHREQKAIKFYLNRGFNFLTQLDANEDSRAMYKSLLSCMSV